MNKIVKIFRLLNSKINKYAPTFYTQKLKKNEILLDVGCGNNSPQRYKNINKNILYFGLDVGKHNQSRGIIEKYADKIILSKPYDDPTHINIPIFDDILDQIKSNNLEILVEKRGRRFLPLYILGLLREKTSHKHKRVLRGTWDYWGFESIIVAKKK